MDFKILVPVDGSDNSFRAVAYVYKLAKSVINPKITILNVVNPLFEEKDRNLREFMHIEELQIAEARILQAKQFISDSLKKIPRPNDLPIELMVIEGQPAQSVVEFAEQGKFDLIVMGARGLSNIKGILLGSVSQKVLSLAKKCPVLVVK